MASSPPTRMYSPFAPRATSSFAAGAVVPIPTLPPLMIRMRSVAALRVVPVVPAAEVENIRGPPAPVPVPRPPWRVMVAPVMSVPEPAVANKKPFAGVAELAPLPRYTTPVVSIRIRSVLPTRKRITPVPRVPLWSMPIFRRSRSSTSNRPSRVPARIILIPLDVTPSLAMAM